MKFLNKLLKLIGLKLYYRKYQYDNTIGLYRLLDRYGNVAFFYHINFLNLKGFKRKYNLKTIYNRRIWIKLAKKIKEAK